MAFDRSSWPAQSGGRRDAIAAEIDAEAASFWQAAVTRLAREINLGWWLAGWLPWAVAVGLVGTFAMLYTRLRGGHPGLVWTGIALALAAGAIVAWRRSRDRFETAASARVRLEEALGLKARLTAASAGVGSWPDRPAPDGLVWPVRWRWQRPAAWAAVVAALLVIAARLPVADARSARRHAIERPTDARVVDSWLDELAREQAVDERSIERVRQRIAELMERPDDKWYEHASLEAAGTLKEQTAADLRELAENLAKAEQAAAKLREMTDAVPQKLREALAKDLKLAALALELGDFRPPADLAEMLRGIQGRDLGRLTPGECRGLCKKLKENRESLRKALAESPEFALDGVAMLGEDGVAMPGEGGVQRGRGDAELTLGAENDLGTKRKERVTQPLDPERAAPDELLAVVEGEHEIDKEAYTGPQAGGTAKKGDGGSAVQVDNLLPGEQAAVRRFFTE
ncbi:hypothetical protein LBMAG47_17080 [Planctomycetia bacterium]|nr:hypothetical protein LBMAG47_17080 [Planctomycetia bacterium]